MNVAFGYAQSGLAIISGLVMIPLILVYIDKAYYGLWLATGEMIGYAGMVDLGVLNTLPYIIAQHDGRKDHAAIRRSLVNGCVIGCVTSFLFIGIALLLWGSISTIANIDTVQRGALVGPLLIVLVCQALSYPLMCFKTLLAGTQDVVAMGLIHLSHRVLQIILTVILLWLGYGLYALAVAISLPLLLGTIACFIRTKWKTPELLKEWPRPDLDEIKYLFREGLGAWLGSIGNRMTAASTSLVIVAVSTSENAVIFAITAKIALVLTPMILMMTDATLVGLAQLYGEKKLERSRQIIHLMLRFAFVTSVGLAFHIILFNASFVKAWVGSDSFGGTFLNILIALGIISQALTNTLSGIIASLKYRLEIGIATLAQGIVFIALAGFLGSRFQLHGIAASTVMSALLVTIPVGFWLLGKCVPLGFSRLWHESLQAWLIVVVPLLSLAYVGGTWLADMPLWLPVFIAPGALLAYLWLSRKMCTELPLPKTFRAVWRRFRSRSISETA